MNHIPLPNTPPTQQAQPPVTPRTRRRAEIRDAIIFSQSHHIDVEGDLLLLLYLLNHLHHRRRHVSRLDDSLLTDIYLRVNLLIL